MRRVAAAAVAMIALAGCGLKPAVRDQLKQEQQRHAPVPLQHPTDEPRSA